MATLEDLENKIASLQQTIDRLTTPPTDYYTHRWSGEEIDKGVASGLTMGGADTPQAALSALGAGVRPNELDNPYFVGGGTGWGVFPVNQRGQTSYSAGKSIIDRWVCDTGIFIGNNSLTFGADPPGASFYQLQTPELYLGKTLTLSALVGKDCIFGSISIPNTMPDKTTVYQTTNPLLSIALIPEANIMHLFRILVNNVELKAVKAEIGDSQTLAYQDTDGSWKMLPQPDMDYDTQLLKCQPYYQIYSSADKRPSKAIDCRPVMRIDPTQGAFSINEITYYYNSAEL